MNSSSATRLETLNKSETISWHLKVCRPGRSTPLQPTATPHALTITRKVQRAVERPYGHVAGIDKHHECTEERVEESGGLPSEAQVGNVRRSDALHWHHPKHLANDEDCGKSQPGGASDEEMGWSAIYSMLKWAFPPPLPPSHPPTWFHGVVKVVLHIRHEVLQLCFPLERVQTVCGWEFRGRSSRRRIASNKSHIPLIPLTNLPLNCCESMGKFLILITGERNLCGGIPNVTPVCINSAHTH